MNRLTEREAAIVRFLREQIEARVAAVTSPTISVDTAPIAAALAALRSENVVNVPAPVVHVRAADTAAVAEAIDRQTGVLARLAAALERLADRPDPAPAAERPRRSVRIRHGDGSESIVREE